MRMCQISLRCILVLAARVLPLQARLVVTEPNEQIEICQSMVYTVWEGREDSISIVCLLGELYEVADTVEGVLLGCLRTWHGNQASWFVLCLSR